MMHNPKVDFIGLGVQKSGTTTIHDTLSKHEEIYVANGVDKDTSFFSCYYDRGYEWYEDNFKDAGAGCSAGEVSTSYFYDSDAPERIKAYNSDIKLFVCLRNPVDRVISNHRHEIRLNHISECNFDIEKAIINNPAYIMQSMYSMHLKKWLKAFGNDAIHVILFDDLLSEPHKMFDDLFKFLGHEYDSSMYSLDKLNESRIPSSQRIEKGIKSVGRIMKNVGLTPIVRAGRNLGFNDWLRTKNTVDSDKRVFEIDEKVINTIRSTFTDDVNELSSLINRDLNHWLK